MYIDGFFRVLPEREYFDCAGDAETWDFLGNPENYEALRAARALELPWNEHAEA
jgi:hypothetical protein